MRFRPLDAVRVVEIAKLIPSALVARKLADLGAEVVKVEPPPAGDDLRRIPPVIAGVSVYHRLLDRNKRSVLIDLGNADDHEALVKLVRRAHVVIDGSLPGAMKAQGVDWEMLMADHPSLVVCSVSGFGVDGPWSSLPSHGLTMEALAGCLPLDQDARGRPSVQQGWHASWAIELGATNAALAIAAAVAGVRRGGTGGWIDASCWDAGVESLRYDLTLYASTGRRMPELRDYGPLYRPYRTADGRAIFFGALEEKFWERFCTVVDRPDLRHQRHGADPVDFTRNDVLEDELVEIFLGRPADEWQEALAEARIPVGIVMTPPDLLSSEVLAARGLVERSDSGEINVTDAMRWLAPEHERVGSAPSPPPAPGADTESVLAEWGVGAP